MKDETNDDVLTRPDAGADALAFVRQLHEYLVSHPNDFVMISGGYEGDHSKEMTISKIGSWQLKPGYQHSHYHVTGSLDTMCHQLATFETLPDPTEDAI